MSINNKYAIIVAGGSGQRMGSKIPKQFLEIKGRPILIRTLEAFYQYSSNIQLVLVLPKDHMETWKSICERYHFHLPVTLKEGGATRFQSVRNGLEAIKDDQGLVAIHDGVRPLVDSSTINASFEIAEKSGSAIAVIPLKNSIRQVSNNHSKALDRQNYRLVQTPQTFKVALIKQAYQTQELPTFTDDASVWEAAGFQTTLFEGSEKNLKITTLQDLLFAEVLMKLK